MILRFRRTAAAAALAVLLASCMDPLYFEGQPPTPASLGLSVASIDTLPGTWTRLVRVRLVAVWTRTNPDASGRPHLLVLEDQSRSTTRWITLAGPEGTATDTFTCAPGSITGRLMLDLGERQFLELAQTSVRTDGVSR